MTGSPDEELPPAARTDLPHAGWLQSLSVLVLLAFIGVTGWVLAYSNDAQTKGILVGAWIATAGAVSTFWFGSSSGGKRK